MIERFIDLNVESLDSLFVILYRNVHGGNMDTENLEKITWTLDVLDKKIDWLLENNKLIPYTAYQFIRLISEHQSIPNLQEREVILVEKLLRERFDSCRVIGRDLIRILQDIVNIPKINAFWLELLKEPQKFSNKNQFGGIEEILSTVSPSKYFPKNKI